jgi:hypothetical protein
VTGLARGALLALAVYACAAGPAEEGRIQLSASAPEAGVEVPTRAGGLLGVEIVRIVNPARNAFTLLLVAEGGEILARFAPFPPDEPARFAMRAPDRAGRFRLRIDPVDRRPLPELVEVRIGPLARRR